MFAFAFLSSPMHPVMTHCNGLNTKTDSKITLMTHHTHSTTLQIATAMFLPTTVWIWQWKAHLSNVSRAGISERRLTPEINLESSRGRTQRRKYTWSCKPSSWLYIFVFINRKPEEGQSKATTTTVYRDLSFPPSQQGYSTCNCHHEDTWPFHPFPFNL